MMGQTQNDPAGSRLGDFEIVREIGRGGMGVVYGARQVSLNRKVALKVLAGSLGLTAKSVQRFHVEAEAAAKLHHTNIVPVYASGEQNGTHFYAMELIDGPSLDRAIQRMAEEHRPSTPAEGTTPAVPDVPRLGLGQTVDFRPTASDAFPQPAGTSESSLRSGTSYFETVARLIAGVADALAYA